MQNRKPGNSGQKDCARLNVGSESLNGFDLGPSSCIVLRRTTGGIARIDHTRSQGDRRSSCEGAVEGFHYPEHLRKMTG